MNRDLLVSVLKRAAQRGATAADGFLVEESHFSASVRMREIENINHSREQRLSLRVFAGRASAAASTSDLSRESLERVVDEATALAKITAEDPHAGLPEPSTLIARVPDLDLEDAGGDLSPEEKIEIARRAEAAALESDPRVTNSEGAEYSDRRARYAYATSHGFAHDYGTTGFSISVSPIASLSCMSDPFSSVMIWVGTWIGLKVRSADAVMGVAFVAVFPLTFLSNAFVPIKSLPNVLQWVASWNPISVMVAAMRELFGNPLSPIVKHTWPLEHPVVAAFAYCIGILVVAVPATLRRYRVRTSD